MSFENCRKCTNFEFWKCSRFLNFLKFINSLNLGDYAGLKFSNIWKYIKLKNISIQIILYFWNSRNISSIKFSNLLFFVWNKHTSTYQYAPYQLISLRFGLRIRLDFPRLIWFKSVWIKFGWMYPKKHHTVRHIYSPLHALRAFVQRWLRSYPLWASSLCFL
jgi:hypothetical protein